MAEVRGGNTWTEELASLVEDTGMIYSTSFSAAAGESIGISTPAALLKEPEITETESIKEQVTGFMKAWGEMVLDLGKGCKDIVQQSLVTEDSFIVQKVGKPMAKVSDRFKFLNEFLPEDRDPAHAWPVIFFVSILALAALSVNSPHDSSVGPAKRMRIYPPTANRILLPDGRHMAYHDTGVPADRARFSIIAPHAFLSSRLAGIPGVKPSLLEEYGVRLVTYDLPGFGESDPHSTRNLNSSALDMLFLANAVGLRGKFWVLSHSSGSMHAWAALRYIPDRIAGAAMIAPVINPYEQHMTKEEKRRTWERWSSRRKLMYFLARKFPSFLSSFYCRSFLSGFHGRIDNWMSQSLGRKLGRSSGAEEVSEEKHSSLAQGMDDPVAPPSMTDYISRVLPGAVLHKLPNEGHFSFFYLCDECHRKIFSTLFGDALGPLDQMVETDETSIEGAIEEASSISDSATGDI
ncbi:hydrolase, putative [Ricinus communis]|uniref:Hydrolase, putative n=1 Tax=Ricinus communis TaxID=3988 RepID=B9SGQ9_RICCO|nr:hydrolase, putative [Ricinus communis]